MLNRGADIGEQEGAVWVVVVLWMGTALILMAFVVDVANWFEHSRHLQTQVDAAALAGAGKFAYPNCVDSAIEGEASQYSGVGGALYNQQVTPAGAMSLVYNSTSYAAGTDHSDGGGPCATEFLDVKATDSKPGALLGTITPYAPDIHANARVEIRTLSAQQKTTPIGLPDPTPRVARAYYVDETTGAVLGSQKLYYNATNGGIDYWSTTDTSVVPSAVNPITINPPAGDEVSIRVALSGSKTNDQCGQALVSCYDEPTATGTPRGVDHIRIYDSTKTPTKNDIVYGAELTPAAGSACSDAYFLASISGSPTCSVDLHLRARFPATITPANVTLVASIDGATQSAKQFALMPGSSAACPSGPGACWESTASIPVNMSAGGWHTVTVFWSDTTTTDSLPAGVPCKSGGSNPCQNDTNIVAQRLIVSGAGTDPLQFVAPLDSAGVLVAGHSYAASASPLSLGVRIGIITGFSTLDPSSPSVTLRIAGSGTGSHSYSLQCNPNNGPYASPHSSLSDEFAYGCDPFYGKTTGSPCPGASAGTTYPGSTSQLWGSTPNSAAQPWTCVAASTGATPNEVSSGLNQRVLGDPKAVSCTSKNNWDPSHSSTWSPQSLNSGDPRIVQVLLVPFGIQSNGNNTYPVTRFATFYVTGWQGSGGGFDNPCQKAGVSPPDDTASPGTILGHFMTYIETTGGVPGSGQCDVAVIDTCIATLTK